jgi:hypothetical protein
MLAESCGEAPCGGICELTTAHVISTAAAIRPTVKYLTSRFRREPSNSGGASNPVSPAPL